MVITGAATTSTLHESRLKIIFRSVDSDSESSSEVTNLRLRISERNFEKVSECFKKFQNFSEFLRISENFTIFSEEKWYFPGIRGSLARDAERLGVRPKIRTRKPGGSGCCARSARADRAFESIVT